MAIALNVNRSRALLRALAAVLQGARNAGAALIVERDRWALWLPAALATGIGVYFALPFEPSFAIGVALGGAGVLLATAAIASPELGLKAPLAFVAAVLIGFSVAKLRETIVAAPVLTHRVGPAEMDGQVEFAQAHGKGIRAVIAPEFIARFAGELPAHIRVSFRSDAGLLVPGNEIAFRAVLLPPPAPAAPGDYDFGRAAFFEGLGGVGYAYGEPQLIAPAPPADFRGQITGYIELLRWRMSQRIHAVLPGSTGAIASAIITGDRGGISDDDEAALRDAGLAHVLAIAGLHMALVGMGLFGVVRACLAAIPRIALAYPIKKWAAVAALLGAAFYLVISGAAAATTRAFVMLAMMLMAILFDRPAISMRSLALAASILLLLRPESLIEPGFQMSFAAVTALIAVAEWEQRRPRTMTGVPVRFPAMRRYMRGVAITSFVGSIATMPYAAFHFDRATHYAVLGNLGAMPIMGFVAMPAAAISVAAMPFGLEAWPLRVMGWGIDAMLAVGRYVSHLPGAVQVVSAWPVSALVLVSLGGLWIAIWRARFRWLGLAPVVAGLMIAFLVRPPDVFIARDGETVALRGKDGRLHLLRPAADEYSANEWLKRDGDARTASNAVGARTDGVRCDEWSCIARAPGGETIAAVVRLDALAEDCARADIVLSAIPTRDACVGPKLVIDRFDVARNGAYAIWLGKPLRVETAEAERGARPWSLTAQRHRNNSPQRQ